MRTHDVGGQLDEQDGDAAQRKRHADGDVDQIGCKLWDVLGQCVRDGLLQVVKDEAAYRQSQTRGVSSHGYKELYFHIWLAIQGPVGNISKQLFKCNWLEVA